MFGFLKRRSHQPGTLVASTVGGSRRGTQTATFAAGCFWGVEAGFREIEGVRATRVGYTGGTVADPDYHQVCGGGTGHAEALEVSFDPSRVTYEQLLDAFWQMHNPTTRNRQGWDIGSQYRSAIYVHDADQMTAALASRDAAQEYHARSIVTEIEPAGPFYAAEDYHQQYFEKQGGGSCAVTIEVPSASTASADRA